MTAKPPNKPSRPANRPDTTANQIFRTDYDGYPLDLVKQLLDSESDKFSMLFGSDAIVNNVSIRFDANDVEQLCRTFEDVIYPTKGNPSPRRQSEISIQSSKLANIVVSMPCCLLNNQNACIFLCPTSITTGETQDETWLFIVNTSDKQQGVHITRCIDADKECQFADHFPNNYRPVCKQQFVYRELLALAGDNKTFVKEKFKFPACCACVVEHRN